MLRENLPIIPRCSTPSQGFRHGSSRKALPGAILCPRPYSPPSPVRQDRTLRKRARRSDLERAFLAVLERRA
eukprot:13292527-Alexandrium_andersonii.AAC.1